MHSSTNTNNREANINREIRHHRRDIMKEYPDISLDEANRLANSKQQHAAHDTDDSNVTTKQKVIPDYNDETWPKRRSPVRKKKIVNKATAKPPTTKMQQQPTPIRQHDTKRVHNLSKQVHSTASLSVRMAKETAGNMVTEAMHVVSKARHRETPKTEARPGELASITVEQVQRLGKHIGTTTLSSLMWNTRAVCATTLFKTGIEIYLAIQYRGMLGVMSNPWNQFEPNIVMRVTYFFGVVAGIGFLPVYAVRFPDLAAFLALACLTAKAVADSLSLVLLHSLGYFLVYGWAMYHQGCLLKTARLGENGFGNGKVKMGKVEKLALRTVQANNKVCLLLALVLSSELVYYITTKLTP